MPKFSWVECSRENVDNPIGMIAIFLGKWPFRVEGVHIHMKSKVIKWTAHFPLGLVSELFSKLFSFHAQYVKVKQHFCCIM